MLIKPGSRRESPTAWPPTLWRFHWPPARRSSTGPLPCVPLVRVLWPFAPTSTTSSPSSFEPDRTEPSPNADIISAHSFPPDLLISSPLKSRWSTLTSTSSFSPSPAVTILWTRLSSLYNEVYSWINNTLASVPSSSFSFCFILTRFSFIFYNSS